MMKTWIWTLLLLAAAAVGSAQQDIPISGLPTGSPMQPTDMIPIARSGFNYKLLGSDILAQMNSIDPSGACQLGRIAANTVSNVFFICYGGSWHSIGGATGTWGGITGTLSNQTDLQNALNALCALTGCTMTGPILQANGSEAAPSYSFTNCTNCGTNFNPNGANPYIRFNSKPATGTDGIGGDLTLTAGAGTGAGRAGWIRLQISTPFSASGTTAQNLQNALSVSGTDGAVTAGQTNYQGTPGTSIFSAPSRTTGVTDGSGGDLSLLGGSGTGAGNGGTIRLKVAPPGGTGSTQNALQNIVTISGTDASVLIGGVTVGTGGASQFAGASSTGSNVAGGGLTIKGGAATNGNANGGDLTLGNGAGVGSGIAGQIIITGRTFANLGTPSNGAIAYCSDCNIANPCTSGGTGAFAKRLAGAWVCN